MRRRRCEQQRREENLITSTNEPCIFSPDLMPMGAYKQQQQHRLLLDPRDVRVRPSSPVLLVSSRRCSWLVAKEDGEEEEEQQHEGIQPRHSIVANPAGQLVRTEKYKTVIVSKREARKETTQPRRYTQFNTIALWLRLKSIAGQVDSWVRESSQSGEIPGRQVNQEGMFEASMLVPNSSEESVV